MYFNYKTSTVLIIVSVGLQLVLYPSFTTEAHGVTENGHLQTDAPDANKLADEHLPTSLSSSMRPAARSVINQLKVWKTGASLKVCFLNSSPLAKSRIVKATSEWAKYASVKFDLGPGADAPICSTGDHYDIKIDFHQSGYWSHVGTDSERTNPSMNLENFDSDTVGLSEREFTRLALHEFGHALALEHEHQSPEAHCSAEINWPAAEAYYKTTASWTPAQTHEWLETFTNLADLRMTPYDPKSIMHYALPEEIFKNGIHSSCFTAASYTLSETDKEVISVLYPRDVAPVAAAPQAGSAVRGSAQARQDRLKADLLNRDLDDILRRGGVSESDRKATIEKAAKAFNISFSGSAGRDFKPFSVQVEGDIRQQIIIQGDANQTSSGPCSPNVIGGEGNSTSCTPQSVPPQ